MSHNLLSFLVLLRLLIFGSQNIIFYSKFTEEEVLKNFDVVVTANPELIEKNIDLKIVKYKTTYNENFSSEYEIETLSEFKELYEKLKLKSNV